MSGISGVDFRFLAPGAYVLKSDPVLIERSNEVVDAAKVDGRAEAVFVAVCACARAFFLNIPVLVAKMVYSAIWLQAKEEALEHLYEAITNIVFIALSVITIAIGIIYPAAFQTFQVLLPEELPNEEPIPEPTPRPRSTPVPNLPVPDRPVVDEPEDDFILVTGPVLPELGLYEEDFYGANGSQFRQMGCRATLEEYRRILEPQRLLATIASWEEADLLRQTLQALNDTVNDPITAYKAFIQAHRNLITKGGSERVRNISEQIAFARFTANIQGYQQDLVERHTNTSLLTPQNFHEEFVRRNGEVGRAPASVRMSSSDTNQRKLWGAISRLDFLSEPDVPHVRAVSNWKSTTGEEREILHLRHATPNIPGSYIAPEYEEFIRGQARKGEGVLYTAYQRLNDPGWGENEHSRCQSLIDLEEKHPNFYLLFHSVESDLFKKPKGSFAELKEALIESFYYPDAPCANRLPRSLQQDTGYRATMENLFDTIHETFFDGKTEIDLTSIDHFGNLEDKQKVCEWQECIMLFYYFQREDIKFRLGHPITTEVNPCKDNFDRGGGQNIVCDRARQHKVYGEKIPAEDMEATMVSVQAPPIMGKGLSAIPKRINPALAVSERLANLPEEKLRRFQEYRFNGWELMSSGIEKREGQQAFLLPKDTKTQREYIDAVRAPQKTYTLSKDDMVANNNTSFPTKEGVLKQLNSILGHRATVTIDGVHYNGSMYWNKYDAQAILDKLMTEHNLTEERALRIMRCLEMQIFADPMMAMKGILDRPDLNLYLEDFNQTPAEVQISLTTTGESFVVQGVKKLQIREIDYNVTQCHFDTTVTLRIPKDISLGETGEWSWRNA